MSVSLYKKPGSFDLYISEVNLLEKGYSGGTIPEGWSILGGFEKNRYISERLTLNKPKL